MIFMFRVSAMKHMNGEIICMKSLHLANLGGTVSASEMAVLSVYNFFIFRVAEVGFWA